ncbi:hypothetical protein C4K01_3247 [Pseudomonas synxantha]|nr:hypothetical protein C4K01_3247 [Pseudomonas synxantha]
MAAPTDSHLSGCKAFDQKEKDRLNIIYSWFFAVSESKE